MYCSGVETLENEVDRIAAATGFDGAVRIDGDEHVELAKAYGMAHRGLQIANTIDTQFAIASGVKGMTALAVVSLIADGALELSTPARAVLGDDLPLIDDAVTVEHLLSHRSGIGDYLDEDAPHDMSAYANAGSGPRVGRHRAISRGSRRPSLEVRTWCRLLVLQ